MNSRANNTSPLVILLVLLGVVFIIAALFYGTQRTHLLAAENGHHYKHAIVAVILAVLSFVGANFARQRRI